MSNTHCDNCGEDHPNCYCTYEVVRRYRDSGTRLTIKRGLTLEEAQEHCQDPETSSSTATSKAAIAHTREFGPWFDGYDKE